MKVALAMEEGDRLAKHFGRCDRFVVYHVADRRIVDEEIRSNTFTAHGRGECDGRHAGARRHEPHSHRGVVLGLGDCNAVLCAGIGRKAAEALIEGGVTPFVVEEDLTPREAVERFLAGKLDAAGDYCRCGGNR
jgi:predicted Fe-Mo cluster-binding NifX family protein